MRFKFLSVILAFSIHLPAQQLEVFPVRVNHKTGFVKFYDNFVDTIIPPRYDYISELYTNWNLATDEAIPAPYRIFETDQHVGLLNADLKETLPPDYLQIRPVAKGYFAVIRDSLFQLIDAQGQLKLNGQRYQDINSGHLDPEQVPARFIVRQNNKYGLIDSTGNELVPAICYSILPASLPDFYKIRIKKRSRWYIVNHKGEKIHDNEFTEVNVISDQVLAVRKNNKNVWHLFPAKSGAGTGGIPANLLQKQCLSIQRVQKGIVALRLLPKGDEFPIVELWNLPRQERLITEQTEQFLYEGTPTYFPDYHPFTDAYGIKSNARRNQRPWSTLVNSNGQALSVKFETITPTSLPGVFSHAVKTSRGLLYGLYAPTRQDDPILLPRFNRIEAFKHNIAIYKAENSYGAVLINDQAITVLEPIYDHIAILEAGKLQVQLGDQIVYLKQNENNEFVEDMILNDSWAISKNVKTEIRQATATKIKFPKYEEVYQAGKYNNINIKQGNGSVKIFEDTTWLGSIVTDEKVLFLNEISHGVLRLRFTEKTVSTPEIRAFFGNPLYQQIFFNTSNQNTFGTKEIVGIKPFLHHQTISTFMNKRGKFGLINSDGLVIKSEGKKAPFSYIGPFQNGLARVCIGGKLTLDKDGLLPLPARFMVGTKGDLMQNYQLKTTAAGFDEDSNLPVYILPDKAEKLRWGYVDTAGQIIVSTEAPHANDFHHVLPLSTIAYPNARTRLGKPRTDYGLIDRKGKKLLAPEYATIQFYRDYLQVGVDSTPTIYFDQRGTQLFINTTRIRNFSDGRSAFKNEQQEWGYLNKKGEIIIPPQYKSARPFSEGLAMVVTPSGQCVFIDTLGNQVFETGFEEAKARAVGDFHGGLCWIKGTDTRGWMAVDPTGKMRITPEYMVHFSQKNNAYELNSMNNDFKYGISVIQLATSEKPRPYVMMDTSGNVLMPSQKWASLDPMQPIGITTFQEKFRGPYGLVDRNGEIVLPPAYKKILPFEEGHARVQNSQGKWGLINHRGKVIIPLIYDAIQPLSEGLLPVKSTNNGFWNFVNLDHQVGIKGPFKTAQSFQNGYSMVESLSGKKHAINKQGNLIDFDNGEVLFFSEGIFGIKKNNQEIFYYADGENNNIFGRYYGMITPFTQGTARVKTGYKNPKRIQRQPFAAINRRGVIIVPPKYRNLHIQPDGNIIVNPQIYYGLVSTKGKLLLDPVYDRIDFYRQKDIVRVERGEMIGYVRVVDEKVEWLWELGH